MARLLRLLSAILAMSAASYFAMAGASPTQQSDPCNGNGPCVNGLCSNSASALGSPQATEPSVAGWGSASNGGITVLGIYRRLVQRFVYDTCPLPGQAIVDAEVGWVFFPAFFPTGFITPGQPIPPNFPPPVNPPAGPSGGPPEPPGGTNAGWNCFGEAVGMGPGGPNDPPGGPLPGGGGGGGWLSEPGMFAVLMGGCWQVIPNCNPATAPAGTLLVMFEQTFILGPGGLRIPAGPPTVVHAGTALGGGMVSDKPGMTPKRPGVPYSEPGPNSFVGLYIEGFGPCGNGEWCKYESVGGLDVVTVRYVVCFQKIC